MTDESYRRFVKAETDDYKPADRSRHSPRQRPLCSGSGIDARQLAVCGHARCPVCGHDSIPVRQDGRLYRHRDEKKPLMERP